MNRPAPDSGFAIGPILFVIALLGVLAAVIAAGSGDFGIASVSDRIYDDTITQANLIRAKLSECNLLHGATGSMWPSSDTTNGTAVCALNCPGDPATVLNGTDCEGGTISKQNLWSGMRPTSLPPPTSGFDKWYYMDDMANGGGRCIWIQPLSTANEATMAGLTRAAKKFSSQEVIYSSSGSTNRFVIWITPATGTPNAQCASN